MMRFSWAVSLCLGLCSCSSVKTTPTGPAQDFNNPTEKFDSPNTSGGAGSGVKDANHCAQGRANASRVTPRVILVLDGSCSMSTNYPANGAESASDCTANPNGRWAALRKSLVDSQTGVVTKLQDKVQFGVVVFGTQPACPIPSDPVKPALNNLSMIEAKLPDVQPGMYTPTGPALDWVYDNLIEPVSPDQTNGPQIVILATDGEPNSCGGGGGGGRNRGGAGVQTNYQPSIDAVTKGSSKGVKTYVISLADSSGAFHDHLQQLANLGDPGAGGNATLYEPGSPEQLAANLETLVGGAIGCDIALDGSITAGMECSGRVTLNGTPIGCNDANGWKLLDSRHIRLQGDACKQLMEKNAAVEANFPCTIFTPG